ncbi:ATP-binding protein [Acinetobacter baumannii]
MTDKNLADTRPAKEYLVNGMTKDVTIEECIFDLIDNSIDAYPDHTGEIVSDYKQYTINLKIQRNLFSINDTGKGICLHLLKTDTLRFGTKTNHHTTSIGYYGIGLNRAIFKLGRKINLVTETASERSSLFLDVSKFLQDNDTWLLPIETQALTKKTGTFIEIKDLNKEVNDNFGDNDWISEFKNDISLRYSEFIKKNLIIILNDKPIPKVNPEIKKISDFKYIKNEYSYNNIKIIIEGGQSSQHSFTYEKSYDKDKNATLKESGWFVYCNDRAVKLFDKSSDTGWDAKQHTQHAGFIGKVYFIGNAGILPWNTSKTDVDLNNEIYKNALEKMRALFKSWTKHTSKVRKKDRFISEENPIVNNQQQLDLSNQLQLEQNDQQQLDQNDQLQLEQNDQQQLDQNDQQQLDQNDQQQLDQNDQQQLDQNDQQQLDQNDQQQLDQNDQEDNEDLLPSHEELLYDIPEHALSQNQLFESFPNSKSPFNIPLNEKKLCSIINEMSKLKLDPNKGSPYAVLFLLRAFIELSCKYYIKVKQSKIDLNQCKSLAEQVKRCLDHMISQKAFNTDEDSRDIDALRALCNESPSQRTIRNIQYLQNTLHHPRNIWDKDNINAFWYSILPFLIKCYE